MRAVWLAIVVIVVIWKILTNWLAVGSVQSALQASQLSDDITATMMILIALTLALWFALDGTRRAQNSEIITQPAAPRATPSGQTIQPLAEDKTCADCGRTMPGDAVRCRACGGLPAVDAG